MEDMDTLLGMLGGTATEEADTEQSQETDSQEESTETQEQTEDTTEEEEAPEQTPDIKNSAMTKAFASMRVENAKYQKLMNSLGTILKVDTKDPTALTTAIEQKLTEAQAKQQNVPVELLNRLQQLEERDKEFTAKQITENAYLGFQSVKDQFKLDDKELQSFADELIAEGINPFTQQVDVIKEYKLRNFDKLMQVAIDRGVQQEAERAAKAASHSTSPSIKTGQDAAEPDKIMSISDLNSWMEAHK